ncbi:17 kDa surface antigen [Novosphingobium sp. PP1Y]|nr:17 kDa surface antigen [Novosphingobium sp. PP1Y]
MAAPSYAPSSASDFRAPGEQTYEHSRRYSREDYRRGYRGDYRSYRNYGEPVYRNTRVWRGDNGRYYCRKQNGTTGLLIGGAAGALLGREVDGGYDRTAGTLIGGVVGALIGREVDRGGNRCR